jgi:Tfp pilus assembly protein PilF
VPRWIAEGLSVVEERRARPGWTIPQKPDVLLLYYDGVLPPPSRLTEGFTRPESPQHLGGAYDLASLVALWIEETRGFDTIVRMLRGYGDGRSDEQIITSVLRTTPEAFDKDFDDWIRARTPPERARDYIRFFTAGQRQLEEGNRDAAKRSLEAAGALFTTSGGGSPYTLLAQIYQSEGNQQGAIDALRKVSLADETAYQPNLELARLLEATGDKRGAADALERAVWIHPFAPEPHAKLAGLYTELGDHTKAVRERRVIVGLRPTDRADAYYQLAMAMNRAGDRVGARREVLRALEAAPSFGLAQDLLLQLHEGQ